MRQGLLLSVAFQEAHQLLSIFATSFQFTHFPDYLYHIDLNKHKGKP